MQNINLVECSLQTQFQCLTTVKVKSRTSAYYILNEDLVVLLVGDDG